MVQLPHAYFLLFLPITTAFRWSSLVREGAFSHELQKREAHPDSAFPRSSEVGLETKVTSINIMDPTKSITGREIKKKNLSSLVPSRIQSIPMNCPFAPNNPVHAAPQPQGPAPELQSPSCRTRHSSCPEPQWRHCRGAARPALYSRSAW